MRAFARVYLCRAHLDPDELKRKAAASSGEAVVQTVVEGSAANEFFVEMIAAQTLRARANGSLLARRPEVDLLLRLAGTTQISKAIREKGAVKGRPFLLVVAGHRRPRTIEGLSATELPRRELSKEELVLVETAAMLTVQRS